MNDEHVNDEGESGGTIPFQKRIGRPPGSKNKPKPKLVPVRPGGGQSIRVFSVSLDASDSMKPYEEELRLAGRFILDGARKDPDMFPRIHMRLSFFNSQVVVVYDGMLIDMPDEEVEVPFGPCTHTGKVLQAEVKSNRERLDIWHKQGVPVRKVTHFHLTDANVTGDKTAFEASVVEWIGYQQELKNLVTVVPVAIGDKVDMAMLKRLSITKEPTKIDGVDLAEFLGNVTLTED